MPPSSVLGPQRIVDLLGGVRSAADHLHNLGIGFGRIIGGIGIRMLVALSLVRPCAIGAIVDPRFISEYIGGFTAWVVYFVSPRTVVVPLGGMIAEVAEFVLNFLTRRKEPPKTLARRFGSWNGERSTWSIFGLLSSM